MVSATPGRISVPVLVILSGSRCRGRTPRASTARVGAVPKGEGGGKGLVWEVVEKKDLEAALVQAPLVEVAPLFPCPSCCGVKLSESSAEAAAQGVEFCCL